MLVVMVAVFPAVAAAQSAGSILSDFTAHGKLTRTYTRVELEVALQDALRARYRSAVASRATPPRAAAPSRRLQQAPAALGPSVVARPNLFGLADLGLMAAGAGGLLILGGALRHVARMD